MLAGAVADNASLKNLILLAKQMLLKKCPNETDLSTVCKHLQEYKKPFLSRPVTITHFLIVPEIIGISDNIVVLK